MSSMGAGSRGRHVILLGGTSEIGLAIVAELQMTGPREVALLGRDLAALEAGAERLRAAGCPRVLAVELDALDLDRHRETVDRTIADLAGADIGERGGLPEDVAGATDVMQVNFVGAGSLLINSARAMRERGSGTIVVLSSVAAERARRSNAVYGASKAGLDALAQGLADELHDDGVRVLVARPGFVHTRMTDGLEPAPLASTPEAVAGRVIDGLDSGADTVWAPRALRALMLILRMIPRSLFRRIEQ